MPRHKGIEQEVGQRSLSRNDGKATCSRESEWRTATSVSGTIRGIEDFEKVVDGWLKEGRD